MFSGALLSPVALVHAQGSFAYTLFTPAGIRLTPGNSGTTTIVATLTAGEEHASNVTLACDLISLPPANFSGTTCSFAPSSVIPRKEGNSTVLTMTVPRTALYGVYNVTVTARLGSQEPIAPVNVTLTVGAKIAVNPTAIASTSFKVGSSITLEVNITNSFPSSGFEIGLFYNYPLLQFQSLDYSGGVLGSDAQPQRICINGLTVDGLGGSRSFQAAYDGTGVVSLDLITSGGSNTTNPVPNGRLFSITFGVFGVGFSTFHFVHQLLQNHHNATEGVLQTVAYDGYFTNKDCGSGLCKPPLVFFEPPLRPITGRPVSINGTAVSQNPGGRIIAYNWAAGSGRDVRTFNSPQGNGALQSNVTFVFPQEQVGEHFVTLGAKDNYNATAYYTLIIQVFKIWTDIGIESLTIDHTVGIVSGTRVHIVAIATNNGIDPENSTLSLSINNENRASQPVVNLQPLHTSSLSYDWDTTGLPPRVYRVDVLLDEVKNMTTGRILENDTLTVLGHLLDPNNLRTAFVQLIIPLPPRFGLFLGLNLPETLLSGIVLLGVAVFGVGLVRKSRARNPEPL